jgi:hypothetical protein
MISLLLDIVYIMCNLVICKDLLKIIQSDSQTVKQYPYSFT